MGDIVMMKRWVATALAVGLAVGAQAAEPVPGLYDRPVLALDPGMHTAPIRCADVDRAGRVAVTASQDKTVRVWSLADGKLERSIRLPAGPGDVGKAYAVAISPDGDTIAAGGWTRDPPDAEQIYLFDRDGRMTQRLDGLPNSVLDLAFSADGTRLAAVLGGGEGLRLYAPDGDGRWQQLAADPDYGDASYGVAFVADGRLATTSYDGKLRLYDRDGRRLLPPVATGRARPYGLAFNPKDGRLAVGFHDAPEVALYDGVTLVPLPPPDTGALEDGNLMTVAWSAGGATLYAAGKYYDGSPYRLFAWDDGGTGPRSVLPASDSTVMSLRPLGDGALLVAAADPRLGLLAVDGTPRWTNGPAQIDPRGQRSNLSVSSDGMLVEFGPKPWGNEDRRRFDVAALQLLPPADDARVAPPVQDTLAIEGWIDGTAPTLDGAPLPLEPYEMARSLAIHPDGERFLLGTEWRLRAFDKAGTELWQRPVPGIVWAVNITGDGRLAVAAYGDGTIRWHRMDDGAELLALFPYPDGRTWIAWEPDGMYAASIRARNALRWVVNQGWDTAPLELRAGQIPESFNPAVIRRVLPSMGTADAVYAALQAERADAFRRLTGGVAPGAQLHVLAVGVSDYGAAARDINLDWADDDANDVAAALADQSDYPYRRGHRATLRDAEAQAVAIRDQLDIIRGRMAAAPDGNDLAVVMFSGHGVVLGEGATAEFYLLPYGADVASESRIRGSGISGTELRGYLSALAGYGRVLLLLDTCSSGAVMGDGRSLGASPSMVRALSGKNVSVLASSSATEVSRESKEWENGAFTKAVLEALGEAGDRDGNGMISVAELADYVARRLPVLSGETQTPSNGTGFDGDLFSTAF